MKEIIERIELTQSTYNLALKNMFKEGCAYIFESYPDLECFSWIQHENYDNSLDNVKIKGKLEFDGVDILMKMKISKLLDTLGDDLIQIFGDHIKITVKRSGEIKTENYYD